ncbi:MAG TPA: cytochrome c oxidase subunit 3 [Bryobacteraceae bacterium]|nr:cytochrome c oxidase subunit 3 [Bryobacteraceae bacterium]
MQSAVETNARERELNSLSNVTVIVILGTVTMTFGAMITVFIFRSTSPQYWGHLHVPALLWLTTAILLCSSFVLENARRKLMRDDQPGFFKETAIATGLGVLFLIGQVTAWFQILHSGLVLANNPHSWFIFLFSGLHALHILLGLGGLFYLLARTRRPASGPKYRMKTRVVTGGVSIFWHYLDFLWVLLFVLLLVWRR